MSGDLQTNSTPSGLVFANFTVLPVLQAAIQIEALQA